MRITIITTFLLFFATVTCIAQKFYDTTSFLGKADYVLQYVDKKAENINLGNKVLEKGLPDIYEHAEQTLTEATTLQTEFTEARDKFVKDNKLDVVEEPAE